MSDLNCELMGKFKVFLLGVPLALGVLAGCSEEVEYEMPIYDFVNPSVCFFRFRRRDGRESARSR